MLFFFKLSTLFCFYNSTSFSIDLSSISILNCICLCLCPTVILWNSLPAASKNKSKKKKKKNNENRKPAGPINSKNYKIMFCFAFLNERGYLSDNPPASKTNLSYSLWQILAGAPPAKKILFAEASIIPPKLKKTL